MLIARLSAARTDKKNSRSANERTRIFTIHLHFVKYSEKKYVTGEIIAETKSEIMRVSKPAGMMPSKYAEELVTEALCCGDVYEAYDSIEVFTGAFHVSILHGMREYLGGKKNPKLHDLEFFATSLLMLPEQDVTYKWSSSSAQPQTNGGKQWASHKSVVSAVQGGSTLSLSASTRRTPGTSVMVLDTTAQSTPSDAIFSPIASLGALSAMDNAGYCKFRLSKHHRASQCTVMPENKHKIVTCFRHSSFE